MNKPATMKTVLSLVEYVLAIQAATFKLSQTPGCACKYTPGTDRIYPFVTIPRPGYGIENPDRSFI